MSAFSAIPSDPGGPSSNLPELDGYDVVDQIGRGGMGVVYEAYQRATGRRVAVKFMLGGWLGSETARRRFEREVELIARLQHPNIVSIIDSGLQRDRYYYIMEFVEGTTLDRWRWASVEDALHLMVTVCEAVDHAHQRGVLHRDLKPSNILVDSAGRPHLLDFGLAKLLADDDGTARAATLSEPGQMLGTLAYMSPEQFRGAPDAAAVRSDVYSLGAILYELLTARPPVNVAGPMDEIVQRLLLRDPPPPSAHLRPSQAPLDGAPAPGEAPGLSASPEWRSVVTASTIDLPDLDAVVLKAIEKDAARRYASAHELAEDLRRCLSGEVVSARRAGTLSRAIRWTRRHRGITFTGVAAALAILLTATFAFVRVTQERNRARDAADQLRARVDEVSRVLAFTQSMIGLTAIESAHLRDITPLLTMLADAEERAPRELAGHPAAEAALRLSIGETYEGLGRLDEADRNYRTMLSLHREHTGDSTVEIITGLLHRAALATRRGDSAASLKYCEDAVAVGRRVYGEESLGLASLQYNLAQTLQAQGELDRAEQVLAGALSLRKRLSPLPDDQLVDFINTLASMRRDRGGIDDAEGLYREALELNCRLTPAGNMATVMIQCNLSEIISHRDPAAAEQMLREALAVAQRELGPADTNVLGIRNRLGSTLMSQGRYRDAETVYREMVAAHRSASRAEDDSLAFPLGNLGAVLFYLGEYAEALHHFQEAYSLLRRVHQQPTNDDANSLLNVAAALEALGRYEEGEDVCREALAMHRNLPAPRKYDQAVALSSLASIRIQRGDHASAASLLGEALQLLDGEADGGGAGRASSLVALGLVLAQGGDLIGAQRAYQAAIDRLRPVVGDLHPDVGVALVRLAAVLRDEGAADAADAIFREAIDILCAGLDGEHPSVALGLHEWAGLKQGIGDPTAASALWHEALRIRSRRLPEDHPDIAATRAALGMSETAAVTRRD